PAPEIPARTGFHDLPGVARLDGVDMRLQEAADALLVLDRPGAGGEVHGPPTLRRHRPVCGLRGCRARDRRRGFSRLPRICALVTGGCRKQDAAYSKRPRTREEVMSIDQTTLAAQVREQTGKGVARRLRAQNLVPAVVYGPHSEKPLHISVDP